MADVKNDRGKRGAKRVARDAYSVMKQINQAVVKNAKKLGIVPEETPSGAAMRLGDTEGAKTLLQRRSDKTLQAVYTLLEANIEAIMMKGIEDALCDNTAVGAQMRRYFIDMYTPDETVKRKWENEERGSSKTYIQNILFTKMRMDEAGMSVEELDRMIQERKVEKVEVIDVTPEKAGGGGPDDGAGTE